MRAPQYTNAYIGSFGMKDLETNCLMLCTRPTRHLLNFAVTRQISLLNFPAAGSGKLLRAGQSRVRRATAGCGDEIMGARGLPRGTFLPPSLPPFLLPPPPPARPPSLSLSLSLSSCASFLQQFPFRASCSLALPRRQCRFRAIRPTLHNAVGVVVVAAASLAARRTSLPAPRATSAPTPSPSPPPPFSQPSASLRSRRPGAATTAPPHPTPTSDPIPQGAEAAAAAAMARGWGRW